MSASPKVCGICLEDYNERERCPRILICSHTLCSDCVENLISKNKKECPFCRREIVANSTDDVIVNYAALELIQYLAEHDPDSRKEKKSCSVSLLSKLGELKREALETSKRQSAHCEEKQQQAEYKIQEIKDLEGTIIQENEKIEKDNLLKFQKVVAENSRTLEELSQTRMQLQDQIKEIKNQKDNLDDVIQKIQTTTAKTFKDISGILDETEAVNLSVNKWTENFQVIISDEEKSLTMKRKRVTKDCKISNIILELLNSPDKSEEYIEFIRKEEAMAVREDNPAEDSQQDRTHDRRERRDFTEFHLGEKELTQVEEEQQNQRQQEQQQQEQQQQEQQQQNQQEQHQQKQQQQDQKQQEQQQEEQQRQQKQKQQQKNKRKAMPRFQLQKKKQEPKTKEEQELDLLKQQLEATKKLNTNILLLRMKDIKQEERPSTKYSMSDYSESEDYRYYDDF